MAADSRNNEIILEAKGISKFFPGVKALQNVNVTFRRGEVHVLIGENGAGKSTLMKILDGIYKADEGEIILRGEKVTISNPKQATMYGISMIHQELSPVLDMTIAENIFL
ncbi:MAG: ATP-binding cassette domain-containing protein, partial [Blautia sp.]|nr:ATP-binding cassette domain-containing protein [Blautia sp.]